VIDSFNLGRSGDEPLSAGLRGRVEHFATHHRLSPREQQILLMLATGMPTKIVGDADDKTTPGTVCFPIDGSTVSYSHGSVYNPNNFPMTVECPLVRDATNVNNARISVYRAGLLPAGTAVECTLAAETVSGSFLTNDEKVKSVTSSPSPNVFQLLEYNVPFGTFDYYYATCTISSGRQWAGIDPWGQLGPHGSLPSTACAPPRAVDPARAPVLENAPKPSGAAFRAVWAGERF
jgi:hypothetical protein